MTRFLAIIVCLAVAAAPLASARADATADCFSEDLVRRIAGCTALIERGDQSAEVRAMRGLAYSLNGDYEAAMRDYDAAIALKPDFAVALNNRAWPTSAGARRQPGCPTSRSRCNSIRRVRIPSTPEPTSARRWAILKAR